MKQDYRKMPRCIPRKRFKIGLNALYLIPRTMGGVETYANELLTSLAEIDRDNEYFVFVNSVNAEMKMPEYDNFNKIVCPLGGINRYVRYAWEQTILPIQAYRYQLDLLHSLSYVGPITCPCKTAVTIHDTNYHGATESMSALKRLGLSSISTWSGRLSTAIVTVSEFSKREVCKHLGVHEAKVRVIYSGQGSRSQDPSDCITSGRNEFAVSRKPYVAIFAGGYTHKNVPRFIRAFERVITEIPHQLVVIGRLSPELVQDQLVSKVAAHRVYFTGYVPVGEVNSILAECDLFAFPSLYEGFGFPILEAQKVGAPVASSNAASLPEVAGEGAYFFDPQSEESIARSLIAVIRDRELRARLIEAGKRNVSRFSWRESAERHLALYNELLTSP